MPTVAQIQQAIIDLPKSDYARLRNWLFEYDWQEWDREFEKDVKAGKVDAMTKPMRIREGRGTAYDEENVR